MDRKILLKLLEKHNVGIVKASFDGSKLLTTWWDDEINPNKRKLRNMKTSFDLISNKNFDLNRKKMMKLYETSSNFLNVNRDKIIDYWLYDLPPNPFLFTGLLYAAPIELQSKYDTSTIYKDGKIKRNIRQKYSEVYDIVNNNIIYSRKRESQAFQIKIRKPQDYKVKNSTITSIEQLVEDYRRDFVSSLQKLNTVGNFVKGSEYPYKYTEAAHILDVSSIKKTKDYIHIANPNNGLYIEPNIHKLWDAGALMLTTNYEFVDVKSKKTIYQLKEETINPERTKYIKMRLNLKRV